MFVVPKSHLWEVERKCIHPWVRRADFWAQFLCFVVVTWDKPHNLYLLLEMGKLALTQQFPELQKSNKILDETMFENSRLQNEWEIDVKI